MMMMMMMMEVEMMMVWWLRHSLKRLVVGMLTSCSAASSPAPYQPGR